MEDRRARRDAGGHDAVGGSAGDPCAHRAALARALCGVLLAASGGAALEALASRAGLDASRAELADAHADAAHVAPAARLAALAEQVHRLERGLRLM